MKKIGRFFFFGFILSCTGNNKDIIDVKDLMSVTEYDTIQDQFSQNQIDSTLPSFYFNSKILDSVNIELHKVLPFTESIFPDRFGAKRSIKLSIQGSDTSTFRSWFFEDSIKTQSAYYNWMDAFGPQMKSIKIGEKKNLQSRSFLICVGDTQMLYLENERSISFKNWLDYYQLLGISDWKYIMYQPRYGKVKWYTFIEDEFKEIE